MEILCQSLSISVISVKKGIWINSICTILSNQFHSQLEHWVPRGKMLTICTAVSSPLGHIDTDLHPPRSLIALSWSDVTGLFSVTRGHQIKPQMAEIQQSSNGRNPRSWWTQSNWSPFKMLWVTDQHINMMLWASKNHQLHLSYKEI